jgi:hypothetical protein
LATCRTRGWCWLSWRRFWPTRYFSFTCLTSVGFGEITPANDHARSLVMIQQMIGVLYFALVGRGW